MNKLIYKSQMLVFLALLLKIIVIYKILLKNLFKLHCKKINQSKISEIIVKMNKKTNKYKLLCQINKIPYI